MGPNARSRPGSALAVARAKIRDHGTGESDERIRFSSAAPAALGAAPRSLDALLPVLYLRGVSTADVKKALAALLGKDAPKLSLSENRTADGGVACPIRARQGRDLMARRFVYV